MISLSFKRLKNKLFHKGRIQSSLLALLLLTAVQGYIYAGIFSLERDGACIYGDEGQRERTKQITERREQIKESRQSASMPLILLPSHGIEETLPEFPKYLIKRYDTVRIAFIGDVMQHGVQIRSALAESGHSGNDGGYDYSAAFKYTSPLLKKADLAVANMEFPLGTPPYSGYPRFSAPAQIATEAAKSGIGLFQIANNHLMDKGKAGIENTLRIYDSIGTPYTGAWKNGKEESESNPKILAVKGIRIGFVNFTYGTNGLPVPQPYIIGSMDSIEIKKVIERGFGRGAEIMIALPHWGEEYMLYPSEEQKKWNRMLIRNGVKIIIGTHPHTIQTSEHTDSTITYYSLGNYISNQSSPDYTQLELMVTVTIVRDNFTGRVTPAKSDFEYLWCFKKGELERDYTVVPVNNFLNGTTDSLLARPGQYRRMQKTYEYIKGLKLLH